MPEEKQHKARSRRDEEQIEDADLADATARKAELDADVDAILDDIDDVLEENAEEFVASFVQKGGQ